MEYILDRPLFITVATLGDVCVAINVRQIHAHKCKGGGMAHTDRLKTLIYDSIDSNIIFFNTLVIVGSSGSLLIELNKDIFNVGKGVFDLEFDHDSPVVGVVSLKDADETIRRIFITGLEQDSNDRLVAGSRVSARHTKCGKE
jgi:hypothetical protein